MSESVCTVNAGLCSLSVNEKEVASAHASLTCVWEVWLFQRIRSCLSPSPSSTLCLITFYFLHSPVLSFSSLSALQSLFMLSSTRPTLPLIMSPSHPLPLYLVLSFFYVGKRRISLNSSTYTYEMDACTIYDFAVLMSVQI